MDRLWWGIELTHTQGALAGRLEDDNGLALIHDHQTAIQLLSDFDLNVGKGGALRRRGKLQPVATKAKGVVVAHTPWVFESEIVVGRCSGEPRDIGRHRFRRGHRKPGIMLRQELGQHDVGLFERGGLGFT